MVLADPDGGMRADLGNDGVHPNRLGYARVRPLAERAVAEAVERADAPADARVTVARREALLRQVAGIDLSDACAALPVPLSSRRHRHRSPIRARGTRRSGSPSGQAAPPNGTFVPATLPADWPAPFVANVASPELRVFPAQQPNGQAVLVIPGGGYQFVSVENEGADFAAHLNSRGYTAFVLVYRLPSEGWQRGEDVPLQDAQRGDACRPRERPRAGRSMRARSPLSASPRAGISRRR
jgi:acetyl esterase/lipase